LLAKTKTSLLGQRNLKELILVFIVVLSLSLFPIIKKELFAQTDDSTIRVRSIMVTVNRVLQELMDVASTVNVITAEDIERSPYTNIADVLATQPGIEIDTSSASRTGSPRIGIRGANNSQTLYVIDGVKAVDKDNGDSVPLIDLSQVERIEIIKGPSSVLYGSEAIGGVINIITKKGGNKPFGFSQKFVFDSSRKSVDIQSAIFGRYKGVNYRISGSGVNAGNLRVPKKMVPEGETERSDYRNRYYSAQLGYDWGNHSFSIQADRFQNTSHYSLASAMRNMNVKMEFDPNDRDTIRSSLILRELSDYLKTLTFKASYQIFERGWISDFNNPMLGNMWNHGTQYSKQKQLTLSVLSEWLLGAHNLTAGVDYELDTVDVGNFTRPYNPLLPDIFAYGEIRQQTLGIYAQDEWKFTNDFAATIGLRFGYINGKNESFDSALFSPTENKRNSSHIVGSLGLVYRGIENLAIRGNFSQGYRYPTVRQLYTGSSAHGADIIGFLPNPDLDPETSNNFELGFRYLNQNWDIDFALFYSEAKDYIVSIDAQDPDIPDASIYVNGGRTKTYGAELSASYTFHVAEKDIAPYVSISSMRKRMTFGPNAVRAGESTFNTGEPPIQGRAGLKIDVPIFGTNRFYADVYSVFAARTKNELGSFFGYSSSNTITNSPGWGTFNLTLGVRGGEEHKYNLSVALRNLFNKGYLTSKSNAANPMPGFHAVVSAGVEY
jgi:hemoglobin/transferrin/lactoferrin receptor protein